jgi:hypothetical protein
MSNVQTQLETLQMTKKILHLLINATSKAFGLVLVLTAFASTAAARNGVEVPEIDPSSLAGAVTLIVGGTLLLKDRFRRSRS